MLVYKLKSSILMTMLISLIGLKICNPGILLIGIILQIIGCSLDGNSNILKRLNPENNIICKVIQLHDIVELYKFLTLIKGNFVQNKEKIWAKQEIVCCRSGNTDLKASTVMLSAWKGSPYPRESPCCADSKQIIKVKWCNAWLQALQSFPN